MNDQNSQFQAILTAVGEAKQANADALGIPWTFAQMGVGDANDTDPFPDRLQTKLINERRRAPLNQLRPDPKNPGVIIAEQVIPENVGGFWIREIGLYDLDGDLVAVANCPGTYKPLLAQGSGRTQIIRMNLIVSSIANIVLKIDPSVVLATRQYVDETLGAILPGDKKPGIYRQVTIDKYGIVTSGANPTTLMGYGIDDAFTKTESNNALAKKADKDKALVVGSTSRQQPNLSAPVTGSTYASGALILREALEAGPDDTREIFAPGIGFYWLGQTAGKLAMDSVGKLKWNGLPLLTGAVAVQEEVDTGSTDTNVVTPFKMRFGFSMSFTAASGYVLFPTWLGGLLIQYGRLTLAFDVGTTFTWPIAWPDACYALSSGVLSSFIRAEDGVTSQFRLLTKTNVVVDRQDISVSATGNRDIFVWGVGK